MKPWPQHQPGTSTPSGAVATCLRMSLQNIVRGRLITSPSEGRQLQRRDPDASVITPLAGQPHHKMTVKPFAEPCFDGRTCALKAHSSFPVLVIPNDGRFGAH
jgi:hypothetical protein